MRGRGEERAVGPSQELLEVVGRWAASLVAEDGRNQLEGVEWRHWRHGHMADGLAQEMECGNGVAGSPRLGLLRIADAQGTVKVLQSPHFPMKRTSLGEASVRS